MNSRLSLFTTFLWCTAAYVLLFTASTYTNFDALKLLANGFALASSIGVVLLAAPFPQSERRLKVAYAIFALAVLVGLAINNGSVDDSLKFVLAPLSVFVGARAPIPKRISLPVLIAALVLITPLLLGLFENLGLLQPLTETSFSIFSNRNNASLYAVCVIGIFAQLHRNEVIPAILMLLSAALFGSLGILLSLSIAFAYYFRSALSAGRALGVLLTVAVLVLLIEPQSFDRLAFLKTALETVELRDVVYMSYAELYEATGSTDLSFFFRLKHWTEIVGIMGDQSFSSLVFGNGVGSTVQVTTARLVPHNDYLRLIFECGAIAFSSFLFIQFYLIFRSRHTFSIVPLLTVCLYMFTENIINNFLAMSMFFFLAGMAIRDSIGRGVAIDRRPLDRILPRVQHHKL